MSENLRMPYLRTRVRSDLVHSDRIYRETAFNGTVTYNNYLDYSPLDRGSTQTTTDVVTPGYHRLSQQGRIINRSFYTKKVSRFSSFVGHLVTRNSGSGSQIKSYECENASYSSPREHPVVSRPSGTPLASLREEAGTQALAGVNNVDIEGLVELAEMHKVRDTFRFRLSELDKFIRRQQRVRTRALRRRRSPGLALLPGYANGVSKVVESNWLRYRYGIMPLLYLLEDAIVGEKVLPLRQTSRGGASWDTSTVDSYTYGGFFISDTWTEVTSYSVVVRAGVLYRPDFNVNRYGLGLRNLPGAAVELTPYSFVADWFVNVSPYVNAFAYNVGLKHLASWTTVKEVFTQVSTVASTWKSPSGYSLGRMPSGSFTTLTETTTRLPGVARGLTWRRRSIMNIPNDQRLIDSWALTMNNLRRLLETP